MEPDYKCLPCRAHCPSTVKTIHVGGVPFLDGPEGWNLEILGPFPGRRLKNKCTLWLAGLLSHPFLLISSLLSCPAFPAMPVSALYRRRCGSRSKTRFYSILAVAARLAAEIPILGDYLLM